jgi:cytochrome c oxidase subunit 2
MTVKVTGFQWKWKYEYMEDDIAFVSTLSSDSNAARQLGSGIDPRTVDNYLLDVDKPLVLPVGKKIKFLITADDVIHAWWVPDFGWKRDAIPGFINEAWVKIEKPGVYRGQCAELCGKDHGFMPIVVEAVEQDEYLAWVESQNVANLADAEETSRSWDYDELMARGEDVYANQCATCHQPDGQGLAEAFPALAGSPVATGPIEEHIRVVLEGREGTAMQSFADLLTPADIAAALTYTRNAFGNDTGDIIQPSDIAGTNPESNKG